MNIKDQIYQQLKTIVSELTDSDTPLQLMVPEREEQGDYSTNVALILAKPLGKSPREVAETIKQKLEIGNWKLEYIDKVDVAGPGFVNFFLSKKYLAETMNSILEQKDTFGSSNRLENKRIITEFTDPNPFKEFHIGHLYSNSVGEAISRLIASQGAEVKKVTYQGDVGLHVAKAVWGMRTKFDDMRLTIDDLDNKSLQERAKFLGEAYALGSSLYEEDETTKQEIIDLNKKIFAKDPEIMPLYEKGKLWSLEYFDLMYQRLSSHFDRNFMESEVSEDGRKLVLGYLEKGVFEESEGAVIFPGEKYGLHNRVFINSLGLPTYEAKELGLAPAKYDYFPYDTSVIITGNEINEYFKVLMKALSLIRPELAEKTVHIGHGMVRILDESGNVIKMASRRGNVLTGEWLLDEAKKRVQEKIKNLGFKSEEGEDIAEKVGVGAVKYALLKNGIGGDIAFSFDESISFEGNAGPYLQYTYVRTQSVLAKSKINNQPSLTNNQLELEELSLLRHLVHFPEVVEYASIIYAPNVLCEYLYQLAQKFNLFYAKHKVIGGEQEAFRLLLTSAIGQTVKNGLTLLGVPTVERM